MAIGTDRVQPAKYESSGGGGNDLDTGIHQNPVPINPEEDAIEAAGIYLQESGGRDETVYLARDSGVAGFKDVNNTTFRRLDDAALIQGLPVLSSSPSEGYILRWNANGEQWEAQQGPAEAFGAWYADAQNPNEQGTTGSSWVEALRLDFPSDLVLGDYLVMCSLLVYASSSSTQIGLRQRFDATQLCSLVMQLPGTAVQMPLANYHVEKAISGSHSYYIEFNRAGGAGTVYVSGVVLIALRVA